MQNKSAPLAERMRPKNLAEFVGQKHLVGEGKILQQLIAQDQVASCLLWGPPGSGKTTLANIIAQETKADFQQLNATEAGVKEIRKIARQATDNLRSGRRTILFIDEIHRFNKSQQDALLPYVEKGKIILIGATTENPSFTVNNALLSRCRTFILNSLLDKDLLKILNKVLKDKENGLGKENLVISDKNKRYLVTLSNGDARTLLNALEVLPKICSTSRAKEKGKSKSISQKIVRRRDIEEAMQKSNLFYDRQGEEHYNLISAFHKSLRGGDANAGLYWLVRMLEGGEDPLYIARRLIRFASEDIGLANSLALPQATAAYDACRFLGMPECALNLAQATVYMAKSKKSIALYEAYQKVTETVKKTGHLPVPLHLRNASTELMRELGYGQGYKYTPKVSAEENKKQTFLPPELKNKKWLNIKK